MSTLRKEDSEVADDLVESGQRLYEERLRGLLEPSQVGRYVAIEPVSGDYFLGDTGTEALLEARRALPEAVFTWRASATRRPTRSAAMAEELGRATAGREALLRLRFSAGETVECLVDTGFTGALVLPQDLVARLNLQVIGARSSRWSEGDASSPVWLWPRSIGWAGGRPSA